MLTHWHAIVKEQCPNSCFYFALSVLVSTDSTYFSPQTLLLFNICFVAQCFQDLSGRFCALLNVPPSSEDFCTIWHRKMFWADFVALSHDSKFSQHPQFFLAWIYTLKARWKGHLFSLYPSCRSFCTLSADKWPKAARFASSTENREPNKNYMNTLVQSLKHTKK